jgi:hypothetical protein
MLAGMGRRGLYFELTGFAAAKMEVRALRVVMIPALAIETVCCSCKWGGAVVSHYTSSLARQSIARTYHDFVQDTSGSIAHLVKLVDTADASIRQNQSSTAMDSGSVRHTSYSMACELTFPVRAASNQDLV